MVNSHHNTTNLKGAELAKAESKAKTQEQEILALFIAYNKISASEVFNALYYNTDTPITSVRRALTNLKNQGKIIKTNETKIGNYGKPEYYYQLIK